MVKNGLNLVEKGQRVRLPSKPEFGEGIVYRVCKSTAYVKWGNGEKGSWFQSELEKCD